MSRLLQLRDAMVLQISALFDGVDVQGHLGRFTEAEIARFVVAAPAVRVAVLALDRGATVSDEGVDYPARMGVYVVTKDVAGRCSRDEAAIQMVEAIALLADRQRWKLPFTRPVDHVAAQNMYSDAALKAGVALWAMDIRQPVRIAADVAAAASLKALFLGFAPDIGTGHEKDYIEIAGTASASFGGADV